MYALIQNDQITQVGALPRLYHDGTRWWDYRHGQHDPAEQGWLEVQPTPRPDDTDTHTHDWSVELIDDTPGTNTARGIIATPNPDINNSPAQYIKAVARLLRGSNRAQIRNLRLTLGDYSTPADD